MHLSTTAPRRFKSRAGLEGDARPRRRAPRGRVARPAARAAARGVVKTRGGVRGPGAPPPSGKTVFDMIFAASECSPSRLRCESEHERTSLAPTLRRRARAHVAGTSGASRRTTTCGCRPRTTGGRIATERKNRRSPDSALAFKTKPALRRRKNHRRRSSSERGRRGVAASGRRGSGAAAPRNIHAAPAAAPPPVHGRTLPRGVSTRHPRRRRDPSTDER